MRKGITALILVVIAAATVATVLATSGADGGPGGQRDGRDETQRATSDARSRICMPAPSRCGFPDASNTGVPPGTELSRVDGTVTLDKPGTVYSGHEVHGEILVAADDVVIENTRIVSTSDYPVRMFDVPPDPEPTGTVIRDVEIDLQGNLEAKALAFSGYTASRVWIHSGADCAHAGADVVVEDSFCDLAALPPGSEAHVDGFQSDGGRHIVFRHNTVRNPNAQTSAILLSTNTAPIDDVVIEENLMSGGGYTTYCGTDAGGPATRVSFTGNLISREFFRHGGRFGEATSCDRVAARGNRWDDGPGSRALG